jgi:dihydrofolate reductase
MRIILSDFMTLDGVVQAPGGPEEDVDGGFRHGGWSLPYYDAPTMAAFVGVVMDRSDALLFGRRTWDGMAAAWPGRAGDPYADQMNAIKKYVASRTLTAEEAAARWNNTTLLEGDAIEAIRALRDDGSDGGLQMWGSSSLARQLVEHDLVDEYCLFLEPVLVGGGKRLFPDDGRARRLELVSVEQAPTGVLLCTYRAASS